MSVEVKIKGFKELDRELAKLPIKLQKKVFNKVTREGAKVIQKEAKSLAPKRTREWPGIKYDHPPGTLKRGIRVRKIPQRESGKGVIAYKAGLTKDAWYGRLVEFGHKIIRKKKVIGQAPAYPFMRPAFDKSKNRIIAVMKATFLKELGKYRRG